MNEGEHGARFADIKAVGEYTRPYLATWVRELFVDPMQKFISEGEIEIQIVDAPGDLQ